LPGKPDLVFHRVRLVVFVDGDFWHGRGFAARRRKLATGHNAAYWVAKIAANRRRDRRQTDALRRSGWRVVRVWESDVRSSAPEEAAVIARMAGEERSESHS